MSIKRLLLSILFLLTFPFNLFAWGSATHVYISKQLCGSYDLNEIYGSIVPDFFNLNYDSPYYDHIIKITHYNLDKIKKESRKNNLYNFALGYISHNEKWGGDLTAHKKARTIKKGKGYVIEKTKILAPIITFELNEFFKNQNNIPQNFILSNFISSIITHPLIEFAIDLEIKLNEDPYIGNDLIYSATNRSDIIPEILVLAYANDLSKRFKIQESKSSDIIRESEKTFQNFMIKYGEILNQEIDSSIIQLAEELSKIINIYLNKRYSDLYSITPEIIERFIQYAISIIEYDYSKEVSETIKYLKRLSVINKFCKKMQY